MMKFTLVKPCLAAAVFTILLTACSDNKEQKVDPHKKSPDGSVVRLSVAVSPDFKPFEYISSNNTLDGYDIDLLREIDSKIPELELGINEVPFHKLIASVNSGKFDIGISALANTEERKKDILFSKTYYTPSFSALIIEEQDVVSATASKKTIVSEEIFKDGIKIGVLKDSPEEKLAKERAASQKGISVHSIETYDKLVEALHDKTIDVVFVESSATQDPAITAKGKLISAYEISMTAPYGYAIAFNKQHKDALEKFNAQIDILRANGYLDSLAVKWGLPTPKKDEKSEQKLLVKSSSDAAVTTPTSAAKTASEHEKHEKHEKSNSVEAVSEHEESNKASVSKDQEAKSEENKG